MNNINIKNLKKLRASVANKLRGFDMEDWRKCLYGHAAKVAGRDSRIASLSWFAEWTGLPPHKVEEVVYHVDWTRKQALEYIDSLIAQAEKDLYVEIPKLEEKVKESIEELVEA